MNLNDFIRDVKDFPKEGIIFKDITTLWQNPEAFAYALDGLADFVSGKKIDKVAGIESRGFIFGGALASKLGVGFVPIRKPGKLPYKTISESYQLEYGEDTIEIHEDAIKPGEKVLLHDDLLATGGTMEAAVKLVERLGGEVVQISFIIDLEFLNGKSHLSGYEIKSLLKY
jgi:adenine phosphoribosyltransferase